MTPEPPPTYFVGAGAAICLAAVTITLLLAGADRLTAIIVGLIAGILGAVWSWAWTRQA